MEPLALRPDLDRRLAEELAGVPEIAAAWLFGSFARGAARPDSDVDIGVLFRRRGDTALDHHRTLRALAARLERAAPGRLIDLVVVESQGPMLQHRILDEGRLLYEADRERRIDFESDAHVRYFDFYPTWAIAAAGALAGERRRLEMKRGAAGRSGAGPGGLTSPEIQTKLDILRENLQRLGEIPQSTYAEFASDFRNLDSALHRLQTSIQALIDIASFAASRLGLGTPASSVDVLERLEANGHLPAGSVDRFAPLFGFRNRVVHLYDRIDPEIVYRVLAEERQDLEELSSLLLAALEASR